jgi:hypothetical protein
MPKTHSAAPAFVALLDTSNVGNLIPELSR